MNDAIWAGEQERQKLKEKVKRGRKIDTRADKFIYMGTRHRGTYKNQIWHKELHRRCNHLFQILSKWAKGFPGCGGPKMGVFHCFGSRPYNRSALSCRL